MTALSPHLALLFVLTTGAAAAMTRLGFGSRLLRSRVEMCAACRQQLRDGACPRCTR